MMGSIQVLQIHILNACVRITAHPCLSPDYLWRDI